MKVYFTNFLKNKHNLRLIIGALCAANAIATFTPSIAAREPSYQLFDMENTMSADITLEEMKNMIYSSNHLTDEEKAFLYNEALFNDVLPYINQSERMKSIYRAKFSNLDIKGYGDFVRKLYHANGLYFNILSPNLYAVHYDELGHEEDEIVAHEYMHATQDIKAYNFFIEPAAELAAHEYYGAPVEDYKEEVKLLKLLMETIGSEPIKQYIYTGDFSLIEERVRPNLTEDEYAKFLECIKEDVSGKNKDRNHELNAILRTLYLNIYGVPMSTDEAIGEIKSGNRSLYRYYFNSSINESYYVTGEYVTDEKNGRTIIVPVRHELDTIEARENMFTYVNEI